MPLSFGWSTLYYFEQEKEKDDWPSPDHGRCEARHPETSTTWPPPRKTCEVQRRAGP